VTPSWLQGKKRNFISIFLCRAYQSLRAFNFGSICSYFHPDSCFVASLPPNSPTTGNVVSQGCSVRGSQTITVFHLRVKKGLRCEHCVSAVFCWLRPYLPTLASSAIHLTLQLHKSMSGNKIRLKKFKIILEKRKNGVTRTTSIKQVICGVFMVASLCIVWSCELERSEDGRSSLFRNVSNCLQGPTF
jgi:hypothetical protein